MQEVKGSIIGRSYDFESFPKVQYKMPLSRQNKTISCQEISNIEFITGRFYHTKFYDWF